MNHQNIAFNKTITEWAEVERDKCNDESRLNNIVLLSSFVLLFIAIYVATKSASEDKSLSFIAAIIGIATASLGIVINLLDFSFHFHSADDYLNRSLDKFVPAELLNDIISNAEISSEIRSKLSKQLSEDHNLLKDALIDLNKSGKYDRVILEVSNNLYYGSTITFRDLLGLGELDAPAKHDSAA